DVLVFLNDKKCDKEVLQSITNWQQREQAEHPPSVVTARWTVENLRTKPEKQNLQLQKTKERREQLLKEEAQLLAATQDTKKDLAAAEALYAHMHAVDINNAVKVTTAALDSSLHTNAEAKAAMEVLAKLQQTALDFRALRRRRRSLCLPAAAMAPADAPAGEVDEDIDMEVLSAENFEERTAEFKAAAEALRAAAPEAQGAAKRNGAFDVGSADNVPRRSCDRNVVDVEWSQLGLGIEAPGVPPRPWQAPSGALDPPALRGMAARGA
ncbi:unnamed protein product, partial [Prorocentrum cordatum]